MKHLKTVCVNDTCKNLKTVANMTFIEVSVDIHMCLLVRYYFKIKTVVLINLQSVRPKTGMK